MAAHSDRGRVYQINVSRGGVPKAAVTQARVTKLGIEGDYQSDQQNHGGPDRALCLYTLEQIRQLQSEGHQSFRNGTRNPSIAWERCGDRAYSIRGTMSEYFQLL